jgi:MFS family permease
LNRRDADWLSQQNAKTDGMDRDLGFVGNQYNTMLSIFYVPYVVFAPPIAMIGKKYGPSKVLPILMFCFGSATLLAASVKNWSGMMALRWFLGTSDPPAKICCCLDNIKKLT